MAQMRMQDQRVFRSYQLHEVTKWCIKKVVEQIKLRTKQIKSGTYKAPTFGFINSSSPLRSLQSTCCVWSPPIPKLRLCMGANHFSHRSVDWMLATSESPTNTTSGSISRAWLTNLLCCKRNNSIIKKSRVLCFKYIVIMVMKKQPTKRANFIIFNG